MSHKRTNELRKCGTESVLRLVRMQVFMARVMDNEAKSAAQTNVGNKRR